MRVLYHTELGNVNEEGGKNFDKIIEVKAISFYPLTREIQIGNRFYEIPDEENFDEIKNDALKTGSINVSRFNYTVEQQQNNTRNNYRRYNNGGYRKNRRFN